MGVLVICVLVFPVFFIVCTAFFVLFLLWIFILIVLSMLVQGLLPPSANSAAVSNSNSKV